MEAETEAFVREFETDTILWVVADIDLPVKCFLCVQRLHWDSIYSIKQALGKFF